MIRICYSKFHRGDKIFGEKPPYEDRSYTHGFCEDCFQLEMEELERVGHVGPDWREEWREFKKNYRRNKMPRERQPRVGDFVLWDNDTWVINEIKKKKVFLTEVGEGGSYGGEELSINNLAPTPIKTWEVE